MDGLRELGVDVWFNLGDRDLALGIERARMLDGGARLTEAHAALTKKLGVEAQVLPMSDRPVRTRVLAQDRWWPLQEFMIKARGEGPVEDVEFRGAAAASPRPEVAEAIASARTIVIGPSNPVISIGPILETPGMREAIAGSSAPVVAVSPLVRRQGPQGPHRGIHGVGRAAAVQRRDRGGLRRPDRRPRRRRAHRGDPHARDRRVARHPAGTPSGRRADAAVRADALG